MLNFTRKFITLLLGLFLLTSMSVATAWSKEETEIVKQLRNLYNTDYQLRKNMDDGLKNAHPLPGGKENPWKGKKAEDIFDFFNKWFSFVADDTNGLEYIETFAYYYYKNPPAYAVMATEPGLSWSRDFTKARGKFMDSPKSLQNIPTTGLEEYVVPPNGFKSYNEYFTRQIKPGVRPISAPTNDSVIVAPADCIINVINNGLTMSNKIQVKGNMQLSVPELLDNSIYSSSFDGGSAISCVLMPDVYHHYHAPVGGTMVESKENVPGIYFGTKDFPTWLNKGNVGGFKSKFSTFEDFHRGYVIIKTENNGYVAMITVGLDDISSINYVNKFKRVTSDHPVPVNKGDEIGYFQYGGSLNIMLFEKDKVSAVKIMQGQQIGIFNK